MPLLVNSVPNLAQGVSQQPDNLRYPGQCDEQINAWATVVEGLKKRPNTNYVKNIDSSSTDSNLFTHFVKRDETNQYVLTVSLGGVGVTNLADGTQYPVSISSTASKYLSLGTSVTNPLEDLKALTVADYTFLVNKNRKVLKDLNSLGPTPSKEALVVVKLGDYEKGYSIRINGELVPLASTIPSNPHDFSHHGHQPATYISGPSGSTGDGKHADTEYIAEDLATCLEEEYGTAGVYGISSVSIANGGSGWLVEPNFRPAFGGGFANYNIKQVRFTADQTGWTVGAKARGVATVSSSGEITELIFTNRGQGYNSDTATYPITYSFGSFYYNWLRWNPGAYTIVPTAPTITSTVSTLDVYNIERQDSIIRISSRDIDSDNDDFDIRVSDGLSNQGLGLVYKEVGSITDLPKSCFNDHTVKVIGDADIDQDDYYVKFKTKDGTDFGEGSWIEVMGWENDGSDAAVDVAISSQFNINTMPITLKPVLDSLGNVESFKLQAPQEDETVEAPNQIGWRNREAGDNFTNPFPSFVSTDGSYVSLGGSIYTCIRGHTSVSLYQPNVSLGAVYWKPVIDGAPARVDAWEEDKTYSGEIPRTINDVFFFKNRLGFVTDNAVIFSEADEYFNFFRTTAQQLLDSAPIDVGLSHTKPTILQHAIPFQEKLMLFSKQSQFVLRGADVLSPKTVAISPVTEFDISDSVEPVALGNYIYFTFKRNDFEGMYEYYVDNNTELFDAEEVTQQVPKYIPKDVRKIAGSQAENTLVVSTTDDLKTLFVYKYFWSNKEKIQSAWMKFSFDRDVVGFDFIDSKLFMITKDTEGLHLEFLTLEDGLTDEGLDYPLLLDSRVDGSFFDGTTYLSPTYNTTTKKTSISGIPYDPTDIELYTKVGTQREVTVVNATLTEKLTNGDFSAVTGTNFDNWTKLAGAYDLTKQAAGILKRSPGNYTVVQQNVSFAANTRYKLVFDWSTTGNTASGSGSVNFGEDTTWELTGTTAVSHSVKKDDGDVFYFTTGDSVPTQMVMSIINDDYEWNSISLLQERSIDVTGTLASYVSYSGSIYKCIETHTSTDSETPDTSPKWAVSTDLSSATAWSSGRLYNDDTYFVIGKPYNMLYRFSDQSLKQPTERGGRSASDYTFQTIRNGSINYADTGHFVVEVTPKYRDTYKYVFNPDIVGANLLLNDFEPQNGHFRFAVQGQPGEVTIEVKSDSALPCKLLAAEFESMFVPRSRRYGS